MEGARIRCDKETTAELCLDAVRAERFSASAPSTDWFDPLLGMRGATYRPRRLREPFWPHNRRASGECRLRRTSIAPWRGTMTTIYSSGDAIDWPAINLAVEFLIGLTIAVPKNKISCLTIRIPLGVKALVRLGCQ